MIEETRREISADERAELREAMQPRPAAPPPRHIGPGMWLSVLVALAALVITAWAGVNRGAVAVLAAAVVLWGGYRIGTALADNLRHRRYREYIDGLMARRRDEIALVLEDGRAVARRVRPVAVVEIQPVEDEAPGYLFDLGDGRVLFLKGYDFVPQDDRAPWPNTDFEIVRAAHGGAFLHLYLHGDALPPLRVVRGDECDPQMVWADGEEVLETSLDEAVQGVLRTT